MTCTACGHDNRAGRKFCAECGAALALACAACSAPYEAGEKFCGECGASLGAAPPRPTAGADKDRPTGGAPAGRETGDAGARKVVTIVFADLVGSTALHERLDAESARRVMERYYEALRAAVEAHGGTVVKLLGDGVMAAFGLKRVAEDDALRAVRAAAAMQDAFRALIAVEAVFAVAGLRVAVNTGEVVVSGARDDVIGDPVNVAARLQEQGGDGDVVLGEATRRLVATRVTLAPLGSVTLKGRAEAVAAYRLESLDPPAGAAAAPFVGRESELARLEAVYDAAVATPATRLAVLLGSPGLGKSRLIDELGRRHADGATILAAHCDAAGGATFAPLAQVMRGFLGLDDGAGGDAVRAAVAAALPVDDEGERARIAGGVAGLLSSTATSPEETFFVVRRFLAGLAVARPVLLVIDDLHWAEPLLIDLVEHLVQWGSGVPLFVLVGARPELRDLRSSLVTPGSLVADVVTLGGLDAGAAMRLAANVIGATDLPAAVAAKVLATSEGNPLFVGELVRMLVQEGALTKEGERWIVGAGLASLEMPPTIHALLAARIERLGSEERTVLERASVVGRHFSRSAVAALLGRNGTELDARLESLRRSELIERDTGWLLGEPVMRFHHVLIRDAAYRRLLKGTRADLHARLAGWIEGQVGDAPEHDEMIGWHLEQAHQHLRELGPLDAAAVVLGERAARRLAAAGRRALARDDVSLAAGLCGRALDRLTPEAPERADLVLDWCEALLAAGDVGPAADAIAELDRIAADSARLRAWHTCFAGQLTVLTAPEALHATADRVGAAARELAALDDAAGEAKAHFVHAQALARLGKVGACEAALDQALAAARRAGDRRRANAVLAGAPLAALWGPSPVTRASGRCLDVVRVLRITQGAPAVEAVALSCQGVLEALRGRTEAARRMLASSRTMVEELGISHRLYETDVFAGRIDLLEGNAPAAERALRAGYEGLRDLGLGIDAARAAALLGRALLAQDRAAEAETLSHESELLAGDDLQAAIAWRGVRAEALARRGDHAAAIEFAEAAVAIAAATDALLDHADARLALAAAFRAGGRRAEADAEERRAFELWEAKGATVLAERARRAADGEVPAAPAPGTRPEPRVQRRVRPNAGSAAMARVDAALAAHDLAAIGTFADSFEEVSHPTGTTYGREQMLLSLDRFLRLPGATVRHELLATLGDRLWLFRRWMGASAAGRARFDVGEYEKEEIGVNEIDEHGTHLRNEIFAADHLGDAIALLYRRYAEGLPPGPARERATVAARAVAFILLPGETPDLNLLYAPTYKDADHRTVGYGTLAREDADKLAGSFQAVAEDVRFRIDDVLALDPNGFVRKTTSSGVWREGGGAFERAVCTLTVFGPDGRVTGHETFDTDREADALARFDALTAGAQPKEPAQRHVRPNAVTRVSAEFEGIVAARNFAALETFFAEDAECIDHPTGATYGVEGIRTGIRRLMQSPDGHLRVVPLATLGTSLGLVRREMSASGVVGRHVDVGAYEIVDVAIYGTDERGRLRDVEIFATERLGTALVRLYERYAESLPEGPASTRARAIARSLAVFDGPIEFDRIANANAPSFEAVDQRILGTWSAHGREEWLTHWRGQLGLADDSGGRYDEVLALEPGAILVHQSFWGSSRASGGVFEVVTLVLQVFDGDGLITRTELFEPERAAEALARFEVLTADAAPRPPVQARVRPNAATTTAARFEAAIAARDEAALADTLAEALAVVDHANGADYGRDGVFTSFQRLLRMDDPTMHHEPLATLGESLALFRRRIGGRGGRLDVGAYERDEVCVYEVDADGRFRHVETFAAERLRAALVRLYERYAENLPEGPAHTRASGAARALAAFDGVDADRIASGLAPSYVCVDHRTLSTWSALGREEWLSHSRAQAELAADLALRDDDVLALDPGTSALRTTFTGISRASGGAFENVVITVSTHDADGLITRTEVFEPDQEAAALACFDALTVNAAAQPPVRRRVSPNAATRTFAALETAFARRDLAAVDALLGDPLDTIEHPTATRYGREGQIESSRRMMRMPDLDFRIEPLATLGDALCLARRVVGASGTAGGKFDVGAYEIESIVVNGVDAAGRLTSAEVFASDHLCQAMARLYALYAESLPDGPERRRAAGIAAAHAVWDGPIDADRIGSVFAASYVCVDHRSLGTWSSQGYDEAMQHWRGQTDLAVGFSRRDEDILAFTPDVNVMRHTYFGTSRASGGPFENVFLAVNVFDADGRYARVELFEPDQEAEALACFDALTAGATPTPPVQRRVRPNAATRVVAAFDAAFARRDMAALSALIGPSYEESDHRTGATWDQQGALDSLRRFMRSRDPELRNLPLATLGDTLMLSCRWVGAAGSVGARFDVGPYESEAVCLVEVDAQGQIRRQEVFAPDRTGDAMVRLYERHAELLPEGPARVRGAATARAVATMGRSATDPDRFAAALAPGIVAVDHRTVGFGELRGRDVVVAAVRALLELSEDVTWRHDEILALSEHAILTRATQRGRSRASGGEWERPICSLRIHDADGLVARWEIFEAEQEAAALARYDALVGLPGEPTAHEVSPFANAATHSLERFVRATAARDWQALADCFSASLRFDDRRPLLQMELPREGFLEQHRVLFDVPNGRWITTALATRGERLVLARLLFQGDVEGGGGALEIDHLSVLEVDGDGRTNGIALFEPAELDAAYAELDARYDGEGAAFSGLAGKFALNLANRDWDALIAQCAPTLVEHDHRRITGIGTTRGREAWVQKNLRVWTELAPDTIPRWKHVRGCERGVLAHFSWEGSREGGRWEVPFFTVSELDERGRLARIDLYDLDQIDQARARFAALAVPAPPTEPFANAATRAFDELFAGWKAREWQRFRALFAAGFRYYDRTPMAQLELDGEQWIAFTRQLRELRLLRGTGTALATRGERLALARSHLEMAEGDVGPSEIVANFLYETNARGEVVAVVRFDGDDLDAAYAELDARYEAGEGAVHPPITSGFTRAIVGRDWEAIVALCGPEFVEHDHRSLAVLGSSFGPESWTANFRALVELAPDTVPRFEHIRPCPRGSLFKMRWEGSRAGGRYEIPLVGVTESDGHGKLVRIDFYDPEQLDQARARFAALAAPAPSAEPFANVASATVAPVIAAIIAHDWRRFAELFADDFRMSDRRRVVQLELDREQYVAFTREVADGRTIRATSELLATRGERLALTRPVYEFSDADVGPSEIAFLIVTEVNERGRIVAYVRWDLEDLDAAYAELDARWRAGEGAECGAAAMLLEGLAAALDRRDWEVAAALHAPALVAHDHRLVGWGTLRGPDAFLEAFRAMFELAPNARFRTDHLRATRGGLIADCVWLGTRDGGAFESPFLVVGELDARGKMQRLDFYDPQHLEVARARRDEIQAIAPLPASAPDAPLASMAKRNAAAVAMDHWQAAYDAGFDTGNWEPLRAVCAPGFVFDDRRRLALISGDVDMLIASARARAASGARVERTQSGTAGDRVVIERWLLSGGPSDGRFEIEYLGVFEVDEARLITAFIMFDVDDARAAQREAWARWAAIEPDVGANLALLGRFLDAFNAHDLGAFLAAVADDVVVVDRRRTGVGRLEGADAFGASIEALWGLAPGTKGEAGWRWPAYDRHGVLTAVHRHGTWAEGGAYESEYLQLFVQARGRFTNMEMFELEDLDAALARFEALRPDPLRIPPNAARRTLERVVEAWRARDFAAIRELAAPDFLYEDRSKRALVSGDIDTLITSMKFWPVGTRVDSEAIGTFGDRITLDRTCWTGAPDGDAFEIERITVSEVDAVGRLRAVIRFDPNDRAAASAEAMARFAAGEAAVAEELTAYLASVGPLFSCRRWGELRAAMASNFVFVDHRTLGMGTFDGDQWISSMQALVDLSPDVDAETTQVLAWNRHGMVYAQRNFGTVPGGGPFENLYVAVALITEGRLQRFESFDPADADRAVARFEELCAARTR